MGALCQNGDFIPSNWQLFIADLYYICLHLTLHCKYATGASIYMHKAEFKHIFVCLGFFVETAFHNLWPDLIQSPVLTLNDFIALKSAF